jgi:thiol:disulfide interchange protein
LEAQALPLRITAACFPTGAALLLFMKHQRSRFFVFLLLVLGTFPVAAQVLQPATWQFRFDKSNIAVGETVDIVFTADIDPEWYLYSTEFKAEGPIKLTADFKKHPSYALVGKLRPISPKAKMDEIWGDEVKYFTGRAELRQTVRILKENPVIAGAVDYQTCTLKDGQCIPGNESFQLAGLQVKATEVPPTPTAPASESPGSAGTVEPENPDTPVASEPGTDSVRGTEPVPTAEPVLAPEATPAVPEADESLWSFFLLALGGGFLALLTPCVYPLIPMTVTFFTKQPRGLLLAMIYGFSIIAIYVLFGTVVAYLFGQAAPNFISTHWLPNLLFFAIFVFFGLSFLGWFEIVLPNSLINKMDAQADRGGYLGVFFMAFTLVLVSFSCTGPIAGSILGLGAQGQLLKPAVGMLGFSLAFAVPFTLFALFPQTLQKLPKSGGWLNTVKVSLGFLELALALKFLSIPDLTYHWGLLDREVYLAFWIVIFALMGLNLIGKLRLPHDDRLETVSVPRVLLATGVFAFVVYLIPGLWGAPLKGLSGWLPPMTTQDFNLHERPALSATEVPTRAVRHGEFLKVPLGLPGFFDYREAVAYAREVNKPLFIDFTGHGCVNCRKMEETVWSDPAVRQRLLDDYVIVSLYVDDKTELPAAEHYVSKVDGKTKTTIGAQNLDFEIARYNFNAQPLYVLVDPNQDARPLTKPVSYDPDVAAFVQFLDAGRAAFQSGTPR